MKSKCFLINVLRMGKSLPLMGFLAIGPFTGLWAHASFQSTSGGGIAVAQAQLTSANDFIERGMTRLEQEDYQGAIDDFSTAIANDRSLAIAYFNRGKAHAALSNTYLAVADSQRAAMLAENNNQQLYETSVNQVEEIIGSQTADFLFAFPWFMLAVEEEQAIDFGETSELQFWGDTIQVSNSVIPGLEELGLTVAPLNLMGFEMTSNNESYPLTIGIIESGLIYLRGEGTVTRNENGQSIQLPL